MNLISLLIALAVTISTHECAHAWVAYKLGDPTAKLEGRVSLNPLRHLDVLGTLMIFVAHFGWGKPVHFNPYNLKHPKRDSALIAMAGPAANFITAFIIAIPYKYLLTHPALLGNPVMQVVTSILESTFTLSLVLGIFNLFPIAPLDGSKFIGILVPPRYEMAYRKYLKQGPFILIAVVLGDSFLKSILGISFLSPVIGFIYDVLSSAILITV